MKQIPMFADFANEEIVWDAHCCVPLLLDTKLNDLLILHHRSGFRFVSVNIGMDMISLDHIFKIMNHFRKQIEESEFLIFAHSIEDIHYAHQNNLLAVAFDLEGGLPFFESEHMVNLFADLGVRQALLAYNRTNSLAGGCFDEDAPLSFAGKKIISAMKHCGIIIDCSHVGFISSMDIMEYAGTPVIFSHANPYAIANTSRNLKDIQIKACAQTGGVICISGLSWLLQEEKPSADSVLRHIDYVSNLVGVEHVGIGLDYVYDDHIDDIPKGVDLAYWWPKNSFQQRQFSCSFLSPRDISTLKEKIYKNYTRLEAQMILGKNMLNLAGQIWRPSKNSRL